MSGDLADQMDYEYEQAHKLRVGRVYRVGGDLYAFIHVSDEIALYFTSGSGRVLAMHPSEWDEFQYRNAQVIGIQ